MKVLILVILLLTSFLKIYKHSFIANDIDGPKAYALYHNLHLMLNSPWLLILLTISIAINSLTPFIGSLVPIANLAFILSLIGYLAAVFKVTRKNPKY